MKTMVLAAWAFDRCRVCLNVAEWRCFDRCHASPHFSHCRGCWLGPCRANRFSHLAYTHRANTPGIGGGAKTCWHDNARHHHPATV
jgi:hypothetical protein